MITNHPKNGLTPYIGSNGNWFIGSNDTNVRANGQTTTSVVEVTLLASDWNSDTLQQTVACNGVVDGVTDQIITIIPSNEGKDAYDDNGIECAESALNSLTFTAETIPGEDILVYVALEVVDGAVSANNVYSTEEQVVGTWIDGKPIYRIVICTVSASVATNVFDTTPLSVDACVSLSGTVQRSKYSALHKQRIGDGEVNGTGSLWIRDSGAMALTVVGASGNTEIYDGQPVTIVFEYTKTTDTATIDIPSATDLNGAYDDGVNDA